jgi:hypothetical protein
MMPFRKYTLLCGGGVLSVVISAMGLPVLSVDGFSVRTPSSDRRLAADRSNQRGSVALLKLSKESQEVVAVDTSSETVTARSVATHALLADTKGQQSVPSLQRLESDPFFKSIGDQRDRSFARLLVTMVERRLGQIDKVLEKCQKSSKQQRKVRVSLMHRSCDTM